MKNTEEEDQRAFEESQRKKLADLAIRGAKLGNIGKMCTTCAFKLDSDANLEPHNVQAAWDCLAYEGTFNCHVESGINAHCECTGFKYVKQLFSTL